MEKIRQVFSEEEKAREKFKRVLRAKRRQEKATNLKKILLPGKYDEIILKLFLKHKGISSTHTIFL